MATVGDFLRAAALFEDAAVDARTLVTPVHTAMGPEVLTGGMLTASTKATITSRTGDAHALAAELARLATECRIRAAATAVAAAEASAYAEALTDYTSRRRSFQQRLGAYRTDSFAPHPGRAPVPPAAPPTPPRWADF